MPKLTLTTLFAIFFFSFGSVWAQAPTDAEKALQQKLDEVAGKTTTIKKEKKTKIEKSPVLDLADPNLSDHNRKVALLARELELRNQLKKLETEKNKMFTPAEKKAEQKVTNAEKNQAKAQQESARVIRDAQVTGCSNSPLPVTVYGNAEPPHWVTRIYQSAVVRVINTGALPIDEISGPKGMLVKNLCSGGSVTLTFFQDFLDSDNVPISLMAIARPKDGGVATAQFQVNLTRYDYYIRVQSQNWMIQLNRQQQVR